MALDPKKNRDPRDAKADKSSPKLVATKRIGDHAEPEEVQNSAALKRATAKKVIYLEIDDEITAIYDKLKQLKMKNVYIVVPKRAILFQSIVNLRILKRKAEDLEKNIYVITNDPNGILLAKQVGLIVYDKTPGHEHPSLVSGKFLEDQQNISPLKASVNAMDDDTPVRQTERKLSISDLIRAGKKKGLAILTRNTTLSSPKNKEEKKSTQKGKLVLVAPNRQALVSLVVVSLIILLTITYIALPGATIKLTPRSNILPISVNITLADSENNRVELETHPVHTIGSYTITAKVSRPLLQLSTGKDFQGENAKGTISVINASNHDWPLVPKTRFQTQQGLIFRSKSYITVPAQKGDTPGKVDIQVEADPVDAFGNVIGDKGNIEPTKFFLPGLSADNQKQLYAESTTPMAGGKTVVTKFIVKEDLEAAQRKMTDDLKNSAQAELQAAIAKKNETEKANLVLLLGKFQGKDVIQTGDATITIPPNLENQKLDSFTVQGEMMVSGVAYSRDELLAILRSELKRNQNPEKRLMHIDEDSFTYRVIEIDQSAKKVKITATIQGREEYELNPEKENGERVIKGIKEHVVGKSVQEARDYIQKLDQIEKVTIESWPAWAPMMPNVPDNIKVELVTEE